MMPDIKALLLAPEARTGHWAHRVRNIGVADVAHQRFSVNESGMDARRVISERANESISCNSLHYKELQD